jgi:hypothetical protein
MPDIADSEAAFLEWLTPVVGQIHADDDSDEAFVRVYRSGGITDPGTKLDHPQLVVSCFGATPPIESSKHAVATTALDALARALDMKGQTVAGCVVTDVIVLAGLQLLPEPNKRWHYQFTVQLTTHPEKE